MCAKFNDQIKTKRKGANTGTNGSAYGA